MNFLLILFIGFVMALIGSPIRAADLYSLFPTGGKVDDLSVPVTLEDNYDIARITPYRAIHINLRNQAGNEIGIPTSPIIIGPANSLGSFVFGYVETAALTKVKVLDTAYTEQSTNAQRSFKSSSANDTNSAGTGARTLYIKYFDQNGNGPYSETTALNGTTCVTTANNNITFIEEMYIVGVGSTLSNVGTLTLFSNTACGATTIGTIEPTEKRTLWAHHYVANGKTANITGISVSHSGTTVGSGGVFTLESISIPSANKVEMQISDFIRLYGQSSTFSRNYQSPIKVVGPARIAIHVKPETTSDTTYRAAIDFYEQ